MLTYAVSLCLAQKGQQRKKGGGGEELYKRRDGRIFINEDWDDNS